MRYLPTKKTVRSLFAAEGFLELQLPERAIEALNRIEEAGELAPYASYLRGQALRNLERFDEAIDALQEAAETIPAPFNRQVWGDLSDCFRQEGLQELADVAEMFAEDPWGGADQDLCDTDLDGYLSEFAEEMSSDETWGRSASFPNDDFDDFNFEEDWSESDEDTSERSSSSPRQRPQK